jgi:LPXTG-site transpeptidase (sortase) family protein
MRILPPLSERKRRVIYAGIAGAAFIAALAVFTFVGLSLSGSDALRNPLDPSPTQYSSGLSGAVRYRAEPGGIYDRLDPMLWLNYTRQYSVGFIVDDGNIGPFERRTFRLHIEKIDVNAPVKSYGMNADLIPEVPLNGTEVAWYTFSAPPGDGGNAVFAAHYTWTGGAVFHELKELERGDEVKLVDARGTQLTYVVTESKVMDPEGQAMRDAMGTVPRDVITLITCDGRYRFTGDPLLRGEYNNRRVVRAKLINIYVPPGHPWNPG